MTLLKSLCDFQCNYIHWKIQFTVFLSGWVRRDLFPVTLAVAITAGPNCMWANMTGVFQHFIISLWQHERWGMIFSFLQYILYVLVFHLQHVSLWHFSYFQRIVLKCKKCGGYTVKLWNLFLVWYVSYAKIQNVFAAQILWTKLSDIISA